MHELSIAEAILQQAVGAVPGGAALKSVSMRAGPLRAIDPDCMQHAWQCLLEQQDRRGIELKLDLPKWKLHCPQCGRHWESEDLYVECDCGNPRPNPEGGDELLITSIEVEDALPATNSQPQT